MPDGTLHNAQQRIGRAQAKWSVSKGSGVLGLTNKDKLKLGRAGARNLIEGTIAHNKKLRAKKAKEQKPFLSVD